MKADSRPCWILCSDLTFQTSASQCLAEKLPMFAFCTPSPIILLLKSADGDQMQLERDTATNLVISIQLEVWKFKLVPLPFEVTSSQAASNHEFQILNETNNSSAFVIYESRLILLGRAILNVQLSCVFLTLC